VVANPGIDHNMKILVALTQSQFVHAEESIQRLPELALLAGSILSFLAGTAPVEFYWLPLISNNFCGYPCR